MTLEIWNERVRGMRERLSEPLIWFPFPALIAFGLVVGLGATLMLGRFVESLLYHTNPRDPLTLIVITLTLTVVAFAACWLPARRATKVDPMVALRAE